MESPGPALCHEDVTGSLTAEAGGWGLAGCRARLRQGGCRDPIPTLQGDPLPKAVPGTSLGIPVQVAGWALVGGDTQ